MVKFFAGAVLQTPPSLIDSVSQSAFSSKYSKHHNSQTVKARDLKLWHNVNHLLFVMFFFIFHHIYFLLTNWWSYLVEGLLSVSVSSSLGLPEVSKTFFYYTVHGTLTYSHILLCHHGHSRIHQTTDIANFCFWFSFMLITLSSSALTILLSSSLCGNSPLSHTFATSSTTCFAFTHFCVVLCHSPLIFLTSVRYW